ncbi:MAG: DNA-protecting protein DprA [Firmicutes bacterium]|nr:DNA-protecting protein DprA [Bacillota bacterium]
MKGNISEAKYYHGFNLIPSVGPVRISKLIDHFGSAGRAWKAKLNEMTEIKGFGSVLAKRIVRERGKINIDKEWDNVLKKGYSCVTEKNEDYPLLLKEIYDPPPIIYYCGDIKVANKCCLAIVGSRRHSFYGKEIAYKFASKLSEHGLTVVSGLARGIDTWAHKGVLDAGGKTAAVLGCGLDICYPPENKTIKKKIQDTGVILSEFPPGVQPLPQNFPRRNRIISGLSLGTIVVEAGKKSGALITADFALEHGREVFAVPGSIASPYSKGCHRLLKEGAKLVEKVEDVIEEITLPFTSKPLSLEGNNKTGHIPKGESSYEKQLQLKPEEGTLLKCIPYEPLSLEEIVSLSKIPLPLANTLLLELELKGIIKQLPGKYFVRN